MSPWISQRDTFYIVFYIMIWVSKHPNLDYTDCSMLCVLPLSVYAAVMYIISATADFCPAGKIKHYFSMTDIPPTILILGNSVIICIDFSAFHTPPGCTVKIHTGTVEINLSTDDSPVSVFIGCKTVVVKINFSPGKSPPAIFIGLSDRYNRNQPFLRGSATIHIHWMPSPL